MNVCPQASTPALAGSARYDWRTVRTIDPGYGRRSVVRQLIAPIDLTAWSGWLGLAQVFQVERTWQEQGPPKGAVHYGITSLAPDEQLMKLKRGNWLIENSLH